MRHTESLRSYERVQAVSWKNYLPIAGYNCRLFALFYRIFISTLVVIQNNQNVQTQGDRLIKVGCIMSNTTVETLHREENTDVHLKEDERNNILYEKNNESADSMPNAIALESSLEFSQNFPSSEGSLHLNASDFHPMPKITLQIIDLAHDHETNDVQIGQSLELQIVCEYTQQQQREFSTLEMPPLPDFRASSLVAKTLDNQNYVHLLDERGCPTDASVFPGLERLRTANHNILRARFHAFKFAGTSLVNFDVKIHICDNRCPEDNCQSSANNVDWYPIKSETTLRQKRQTSTEQQLQQLKVQNPVYISTVMDVENSNVTNEGNFPQPFDANTDVIPLNFNLNVRGPDNTNKNSFIYGERGILLIAGIGEYGAEDFFNGWTLKKTKRNISNLWL